MIRKIVAAAIVVVAGVSLAQVVDHSFPSWESAESPWVAMGGGDIVFAQVVVLYQGDDPVITASTTLSYEHTLRLDAAYIDNGNGGTGVARTIVAEDTLGTASYSNVIQAEPNWPGYFGDDIEVWLRAYDGATGELVLNQSYEIKDIGPVVDTMPTVSLTYGDFNGDDLQVSYTGGSFSKDCYVALYVDYQTSMPDYGGTDYNYIRCTRSCGVDSTVTAVLNSTPVHTIDYVYNTDFLEVTFQLIDENGNRSPVYELFDGRTVTPLGDVPTLAHDEWGVSAFQSGESPYGVEAPGTATIAEWSKSHVIVVDGGMLFGSTDLDNQGYGDAWIKRARETTGANNKAAVEHIGTFCNGNPNRVFGMRRYLWATHLLDSLRTAASEDTMFLVHDKNDSITFTAISTAYPSYEVNLLNDFGLERYAQFIANQWNHSENRLPFTGYLFDVWESITIFPAWDRDWDADPEPRMRLGAHEADLDDDGTELSADFDEQNALAYARAAFADELFERIDSSNPDSVQQYFLFGGNTDSALQDKIVLQSMNIMTLEDGYSNAANAEEGGYIAGYIRGKFWQNFADSDFVADYSFVGYNLLVPSDTIPRPENFSAHLDMANHMKDLGHGPFILPEMENTDADYTMDIRQIETYYLLGENFYPIFTDTDNSVQRVWNYPTEEGWTALDGLGAATGSTAIDSTALYWEITKPYENGTVTIQLPTRDIVDFETDSIEFNVEVNDVALRQSSGYDEDLMTYTPATSTVAELGFYLESRTDADSIRVAIYDSALDLVAESPSIPYSGIDQWTTASWSGPALTDRLTYYIGVFADGYCTIGKADRASGDGMMRYEALSGFDAPDPLNATVWADTDAEPLVYVKDNKGQVIIGSDGTPNASAASLDLRIVVWEFGYHAQ